MSPDCYSPLGVLLYWAGQSGPVCTRILESIPPDSFSVPVLQYLKTFGMTLLLESPFYLFLLRRYPFKTRLKVLLILNLCTHPAVYFLFPATRNFGLNYVQMLTSAEIFAPLVEIILAKKWVKQPAERVGFLVFANVFSWWAGIYLT